MASTAAANNNFHISDEVYDRARAEYEAAIHEGGGSILKDYYTIFEYRHRREKFFDKLPGWSRRPRAISEMAKTDAELIFDEYDGIQQLDALEVREREIAHEFPVLLPLPTTANTQTIDNFKTCPPIDGSRVADEDSNDDDRAVEEDDYELDEAEEDSDDDAEDGRDVPTPGGSATPVPSPNMNTVSELDKKLAILRDPTSIANLTDLATPILPGYVPRPKKRTAPSQPPVSTSPVDAVYTQKTTTSPRNFTVAPGVSSMSRYGMPAPVKSQQRQHTPAQAKTVASKPTSASKISKISKIAPKPTATTEQKGTAEPVAKKQKVDHVAAKPAKALTVPTISQPPTNKHQAPAVSSDTANRTTSRPITKTNQPPAVSSSIVRTTTSQSTTSNQQPARGSGGGALAFNTHLAAIIYQPAAAPSNASATTAVAATTPAAVSATVPVAAPAAAFTTASADTSAATQRRLNDIIAGRILPRSKQEAQDAADEQHHRLLAAYRAQNQSQGTTRRSARQSATNTNPNPDFMPHYFSAANFPAEEVESGGCTRCICGATENDPDKGAVECETCGVWQHVNCLYGDLTEKELEELKHFCTACDPYAHRHVLKALRAGEADGGEQNGNGKGQAKGKPKAKAKGKSKK